jgi:hypothetical protein
MLSRIPRRTLVAALAMSAAAAVSASPAMAQSAAQHDHAAHAAHAAHDAPAPARRWATDAPLRAGMRSLAEATEALDHYQMGHLDDTQRDNAVARIDAAIQDMFTNCKLAPEADAALHGLLAKFIAGGGAARAGKFSKAELAPMQEALVLYPQMFDDHDWGEAAD